jgi:hypothetical protein
MSQFEIRLNARPGTRPGEVLEAMSNPDRGDDRNRALLARAA